MEIDIFSIQKTTPVIGYYLVSGSYDLPGGWQIHKPLLDQACRALKKRPGVFAAIDPEKRRLNIYFGKAGRLSLNIHMAPAHNTPRFPKVFGKLERSYQHAGKCVIVSQENGAFAIVDRPITGLPQLPMPQVLDAALAAGEVAYLIPRAFKIPPKKTTPSKDYEEGLPYDDDCYLIGDREVSWSRLSSVIGKHKRLTYLSISPIIAIYSDGKLIGGVAYAVRDFRVVAPLIPGAKATNRISMEIHRGDEVLTAIWDRGESLIKVRSNQLLFTALSSVELVNELLR